MKIYKHNEYSYRDLILLSPDNGKSGILIGSKNSSYPIGYYCSSWNGFYTEIKKPTIIKLISKNKKLELFNNKLILNSYSLDIENNKILMEYLITDRYIDEAVLKFN